MAQAHAAPLASSFSPRWSFTTPRSWSPLIATIGGYGLSTSTAGRPERGSMMSVIVAASASVQTNQKPHATTLTRNG
jgi:hypothetical protein